MRLFEGTAWDRPPTCERCGVLESECRCPPLEQEGVPAERQTARIQVEKRKGAKTVTVIRGLVGDQRQLSELLKQLKTGCGAGGSVQEDRLELQGDQSAQVREMLARLGYKVR